MINGIIPHNKPSRQLLGSNSSTVQKLPSAGSIIIELQDAWVEFIKRFEPFYLYVTLTFKDPKHPEAADKAFFRQIRHINESLYGRRYREKKKGVTWIKCMEYQKRDVIHFHCLIGDPHLDKSMIWGFMKAWEYDCYRSKELVNRVIKDI